MKSLSLIAALVGMFSAVQAQFIDLSKYDQLPIEKRMEFFGGMTTLRLQYESDFLKALVLGVQDTNEAVRRRATQRAAMTLQMLQPLAQVGQHTPVTPADLEALEGVMKGLINDPDRETRAAAVQALAAVREPSQSTEMLLLDRLETEEDAELRANLIETMTTAGYQSERFRQAIVNRIAEADGKELEALVASASRLRLTEALPALIERIGEPDTPQVLLLRSVGKFGKAASTAKAKLEAIIADPTSTNQAEAQSALTALVSDPPTKQPIIPFVDLIANGGPQNTALPIDGAVKAPLAQPAAPEKTSSAASSEELAFSTPWSVVAVLIVAAAGLLWLVLKKRK